MLTVNRSQKQKPALTEHTGKEQQMPEMASTCLSARTPSDCDFERLRESHNCVSEKHIHTHFQVGRTIIKTASQGVEMKKQELSQPGTIPVEIAQGADQTLASGGFVGSLCLFGYIWLAEQLLVEEAVQIQPDVSQEHPSRHMVRKMLDQGAQEYKVLRNLLR